MKVTVTHINQVSGDERREGEGNLADLFDDQDERAAALAALTAKGVYLVGGGAAALFRLEAVKLHTDEPWYRVGFGLFGPLGKGRDIAYGSGMRPEHERIADLERAAACVNACAGISTEDLKAFASLRADVGEGFAVRLAWAKLRGEG